MNWITRKHLSRRTLLRGIAVGVALPWLDAMLAGADAALEIRRQATLAHELRVRPARHGHGSNLRPRR
jgi:hypothetical protein